MRAVIDIFVVSICVSLQLTCAFVHGQFVSVDYH